MTRHITDSERLTIATLNRRETELKEARDSNEKLKSQLKVMKDYITELKESNKMLAAQIRYLVSKKTNNA